MKISKRQVVSRLVLILIVLGFSIPLFASSSSSSTKELSNKNCNLYLPTNMSFSNWGNRIEDFQKRGYTSIELDEESLPKMYVSDDLVASIGYTITTEDKGGWFGNDNTCEVQLSIKKVLQFDDRGEPVFANVFMKTVEEKSRGDNVSCKRAVSKTFAAVPECVVSQN